MARESSGIRWGRVLIESAAIVVSILLAFGIDAWWDTYRERQREHEIVTALAADFEQNRLGVERTIALHEAAVVRFARLRQLSAAAIAALPPDSLVEFASLASPYTFDATRANLDALIGSGELGLVRDPRLRGALVEFLTLVDDSGEDVRYLANAAEAVWAERLRIGGPWSSDLRGSRLPIDPADVLDPFTASDLARVARDEAVMASMAQFQVVVSVYLEVLAGIQEQIEIVAGLLEASAAP